ncbi:MAG TPA: DM13 domain-containing protein [Ktedonobacterales bacterium]|nr:DM13 domain-containing protein [Ktedonobacterales bacterium]
MTQRERDIPSAAINEATTRATPPNRALFAVTAGGAVAVIPLALVVFPNIVRNPVILTLTVLTPLSAGLSVALALSGAQRALPRLWGTTTRVVTALVVVADLYVLVLPIFVAGPARHDSVPNFVATHPPATSAAQQPTLAPATLTPAPLVLSGTFVSGNQHGDYASGTATAGVTTTGALQLALTHFAATNGPDVYVYLSREASPATTAQVMNGYEVGKLTATSGDLLYTLPAGLNLREYRSVVVYCRSFSVVFGYANLA